MKLNERGPEICNCLRKSIERASARWNSKLHAVDLQYTLQVSPDGCGANRRVVAFFYYIQRMLLVSVPLKDL